LQPDRPAGCCRFYTRLMGSGVGEFLPRAGGPTQGDEILLRRRDMIDLNSR
jgi:hypothetical protein